MASSSSHRSKWQKIGPDNEERVAEELQNSKKELKKSQELLMQAAANVETMMALQEENEKLREQVRKARRG
jgi:hypothetical protein